MVRKSDIKILLCTRNLWNEHFTQFSLLQNNFGEFTTQEHKFKRWFCTQELVLNVCFNAFWYTKNLTHIWFDKFNGLTNSINQN